MNYPAAPLPDHEGEYFEKKALEILTRHFRAVPHEKYHPAMLNHLGREACEEVVGRNYTKPKVSERKSREIRDLLRKKLQQRYGKWVNVVHFRMKGTTANYNTNFSQVFSTPEGLLYRAAAKGIAKDIYFTSHCLERFEERADPKYVAQFAQWLTHKLLGAKPTAVDLLHGLVFVEKDFEHARRDESWYLNLKVGVLVMENFDDIFVAKTFLGMDMVESSLVWHMPLLDPEVKKDPGAYSWSIKKIMMTDPVKIETVMRDTAKIEAALERFKKQTALFHVVSG